MGPILGIKGYNRFLAPWTGAEGAARKPYTLSTTRHE